MLECEEIPGSVLVNVGSHVAGCAVGGERRKGDEGSCGTMQAGNESEADEIARRMSRVQLKPPAQRRNSCEAADPLEAPKPRKIKSSSKVTKKGLSGSPPK